MTDSASVTYRPDPPQFDPKVFTERKANLPFAFVQGAAVGFGTSLLIDKILDKQKFDFKQSIVTALVGGVLDGTIDYFAAKRYNRELKKTRRYVEDYLAERDRALQEPSAPTALSR